MQRAQPTFTTLCKDNKNKKYANGIIFFYKKLFKFLSKKKGWALSLARLLVTFYNIVGRIDTKLAGTA